MFLSFQKYLSRHVQDTPTTPRLGHLGAPPPYQSPRGSVRQSPHLAGLSGIGTGSNLVTPPTIAYHSGPIFDHLDGADEKSPLVRSDMHHSAPSQSHPGMDMIDGQQAPPIRFSSVATTVLPSQSHTSMGMIGSQQAPPSVLPLAATPVLPSQSHTSMGMIGSQQAPPSGLSLGATPDVRGVDQSLAGMNMIGSQLAPPSGLSLGATPDVRGVNQSLAGMDLIGSQQAPPSGFSLGATPAVDQSVAASALIDRNMLLPPHLSDQSSLRFPTLGVSRAYPSEEEELDDLLQKLDDAYPVNFTYGK